MSEKAELQPEFETFAEIEIRPGVTFPARHAVTSPRADKALEAILKAFGIENCWRGYGSDEDTIRRAVLEHFRDTGGPPSLTELAETVDLPAALIPPLLTALRARDLLVLDEDGQITGVYPLTIKPTDHVVRVDGHAIHAMCAVDALGAGAMFGTDVSVSSVCRNCAAAIHAETADQGRRVAAYDPPEAVVWSGVKDAEGCAETSLCTVIAFFCGTDCQQAWRNEHYPEAEGYVLSLAEGLEVGRAIFEPMLTEGQSR